MMKCVIGEKERNEIKRVNARHRRKPLHSQFWHTTEGVCGAKVWGSVKKGSINQLYEKYIWRECARRWGIWNETVTHIVTECSSWHRKASINGDTIRL